MIAYATLLACRLFVHARFKPTLLPRRIYLLLSSVSGFYLGNTCVSKVRCSGPRIVQNRMWVAVRPVQEISVVSNASINVPTGQVKC